MLRRLLSGFGPTDDGGQPRRKRGTPVQATFWRDILSEPDPLVKTRTANCTLDYKADRPVGAPW